MKNTLTKEMTIEAMDYLTHQHYGEDIFEEFENIMVNELTISTTMFLIDGEEWVITTNKTDNPSYHLNPDSEWEVFIIKLG
jgi:hypothetical protein